MKVKTSELTGPALDWSVAKCEGGRILDVASFTQHHSLGRMRFSTDWAHGGPIIELEFICLKHGKFLDLAAYIYKGDGYAAFEFGPTPLVAAMRAFVASKLGDTVDVPEELA